MVDSFLHEYSAGGEAHLPLVDEGGAEDGRETLVQVSIIENDASILASQLWWRRGWRRERRWMRRKKREGGRGEKGTDEWVRKECKREGRKVYYICKDPSLRTGAYERRSREGACNSGSIQILISYVVPF